jgi:NAD(P)-dependent dehydrogenase (short-subunit alcohol dehydrogenase family)
MANMLIIGASRGLGAAFSAGVASAGDTLWLVSRSRPALGSDDGVQRRWIEADLSRAGAGAVIAEAVGPHGLDALVYNAGIWEANGFDESYDFRQVSEAETHRIIAVNLTSAITCVQSLVPALLRVPHSKVILIGSTSGLENVRSRELAYTASKSGLRGVARSLRENLREHGIAVTCINPGELANEMPWERGAQAALSAYGGRRIPVQDVVALVRCVLALSPASCVTQIDVPALTDRTA